MMKLLLSSAIVVIVLAGVVCAGTPRGPNAMSSTAAPQDANRTFVMNPLPVPNAPAIDGLALVERRGVPTLLFSTQAAGPGYQLVLHAAPVADASRAAEVMRIDRMLPVPPAWDARPAGTGFDVVYERALGAVNAIVFRDAQGNTVSVSEAHPSESFSRPHFVDAAGGPDIAATADFRRIVVFPGGARAAVKYLPLADGADGVVGGAAERWAASKNSMSGEPMFDVLPGRLTVTRIGAGGTRTAETVPDFLAYELDAAPNGGDVVIFATSRPAQVFLASRAERPFRLSAANRAWLLQLSRPAVLVTAQAIHLAAIAQPQTDEAAVLYGTLPLSALAE